MILSKAAHIAGELYAAGSAARANFKDRKPADQKIVALHRNDAAHGSISTKQLEPQTEPCEILSTLVLPADAAGSTSTSTKQPGQQTEPYEILSALVEGVYAADRGKVDAHLFWEPLGYEKEALQDEHPEEDIAAVGKPSCKIRLMVFRRRDLRPPSAPSSSSSLPKYVVAIRGTRKYCQRDILADLQILCETLHRNPLFDVVKKMTRRVVERHSHDTVCVAGHSLGAAIGLLVTRELALEDMPVETHLFNPPFFSLETLVEKLTSFIPKGLSLLNQARHRSSGSRSGSGSGGGSSCVMKFVKAKKTKRDAEYLDAMAPEFVKLEKWVPHMYVNPYDPICNGYIHYFKNQNMFYGGPETLAISLTAGTLRRFTSLDSYSYHLIPSAILHINHRGSKNVLEAHPLQQWHKHPTVDLQHETHQLLRDSGR